MIVMDYNLLNPWIHTDNEQVNRGEDKVPLYSKTFTIKYRRNDRVRKSPYCSFRTNNWFSQKSSMDIKSSRWKLDEVQEIYIVLMYSSHYLFIIRGKTSNFIV